jgi:uncharacterized protein YcaQ
MTDTITISPTLARRLAVTSQWLDAQPRAANKVGILDVIRQIGCLQIDPINVVARNPLLILWSRLGNYNVADLESLLWEEKVLFEYWAHAASIVLAEDYPLHYPMMQRRNQSNSLGAKQLRKWLAENEAFRDYILETLRENGPLYANEFEDKSVTSWEWSGWSSARNVTMMLDVLWTRGHITVSQRQGQGFGLKKQWALTHHHLPQWASYEPLTERELVIWAAEKSLKALGVGTEKHIRNHFIRGRYPSLPEVLAELVANGRIHPLTICDNNSEWPDTWYIHDDDLPTLASLQAGDWQPATRLLSPFDNLICDRDRTELMFDFYYRTEIYTPKAKRVYGYYVMPILQGARLIGRIDPKMDRKTKQLLIHAVHAEPDAPETAETTNSIAAAITDLAQFLGPKEVIYSDQIPSAWQSISQ